MMPGLPQNHSFTFSLTYCKILTMSEYISRDKRIKAFKEGIIAGIPIGLGYFAVSFSLGIAARGAGLSPLQGFVASILCLASAGEYVGFTLIAASASYIEVAIATLIANARYLLMSTSMSQRLHPDMPYRHRFFLAYGITDELFGIAISREGYLNPWYSYGAFIPSMSLWAVGTSLGIIAGNALPIAVVSALSVALFGMFIAIIIPPAKKDRIILGLIVVSFVLSYIASVSPFIKELSDGTRTIILTVIISAAAALLFPREQEEVQDEP